jgi:hypothetical protein
MSLEQAVKDFLPIVKEAKQAKLNEADTRTRVLYFLEKVLGYNPLKEITQEFMVSGRYVDLAVKIRGNIKFFVEVKAVGTRLRDAHVHQAVQYAANEGVPVAILTNLDKWRIYSVSLDEGKVEHQLVAEFSLLEDDLKDVIPLLKMLSRSEITKGTLYKFASEITSLSDKNLLMALLSENVLKAITKELKAITGHRVNREILTKTILNMFSDKVVKMVQKELAKRKSS